MSRRGQKVCADIAAPCRVGLKERDVVVPANVPVSVRELAEVDKIGAAAKHHMLRIDHLIQRRMRIRVRASADIRLTLQQGNLRARTRQRNRRRKPSEARSHNQNIALRICVHPKRRAFADSNTPPARIVSFRHVGTETRSRKTAAGSAAMRSSSP